MGLVSVMVVTEECDEKNWATAGNLGKYLMAVITRHVVLHLGSVVPLCAEGHSRKRLLLVLALR
jgi:hypothetical protein